ncbi:MAG TPA: hypothetical protein VEA81_09295 [Burkholderiaceae bacterium]|nr:hypothetical protein [Burkholderiaceae bacterium]
MSALLGIVHTLVWYVMLLLIGQFLVRLMSFGRHEQNPVYRLFRFLTSPVVRVARAVTPAKVSDDHVPVVAFLLLFWIFLGLALWLPRLAGVGG